MTDHQELPEIQKLDEPLPDEAIRAIVHWLAHSTANITALVARFQSDMLNSLIWILHQLDPQLDQDALLHSVLEHVSYLEQRRDEIEEIGGLSEIVEALRDQGVEMLIQQIDREELAEMLSQFLRQPPQPPSRSNPEEN